MATKRGFVQKIDVDRAGLVRVSLAHVDGSNGVYVIRDLDADPERFNERLSKLGILRDAMNRAEPVEIEHVKGEAGEEIQRATRITRDLLEPSASIVLVSGLVVDVVLHSRHGASGEREAADLAQVAVVALDLTPHRLTLSMQIPERLVAQQQLEMIRDAQSRGRLARFLVSTRENERRIVAVATDNSTALDDNRKASLLDGFVESLSLIDEAFLGAPSGSFAHVRFTTAPPFTGAGNTVGLAPFRPWTIALLVPRGSLAYELFEAGLRDNLRMQVSASLLAERRPEDEVYEELADEPVVPTPRDSSGGANRFVTTLLSRRDVGLTDQVEEATLGICWGAELLAPLGSASRPVWITIARRSLDHGPDGYPCTDGVPSSDLEPKTLRELRIPYPAAWEGLGCFNPGVYRLQFDLPGTFRVLIDGKPLCVHDSDLEKVKFAYACLEGDHLVRVEIDAWTCDDRFDLDVYRLR